ncbi:hypothetical protein FRC04_009092 [Tulasnella sp. 424]|nr:hypothetical protein FRC04_009092 [Tulasnella sp. 424]KAG8974662.1 hypothetical protein FRC05_006996 [Tulasnella sp. 425]
MATIQAITPAGASAAIRQNMALSGGDRGTKASSFFAGYGPSPVRRPCSTFSHEEPGQSSVSARYDGVGLSDGAMATAEGAEGASIRRPPTTASEPSARVSRVSLSANIHPPHPSTRDSLRTSVYTNDTSRASRAYHRATAHDDEVVPPIPSRLDEMQLRPTQTDGPAPLTPQEIRAKIGADASAPRSSVGELMRMPALSALKKVLTRCFYPPPPAPPAPVVTYPAVPTPALAPAPALVQSNFGMPTLNDPPAGAMSSPDEKLKAYAIFNKKSLRATLKRGNTIETTTSANVP